MRGSRATPWLFALPALAVFCSLVVYPALEGLILGMTDLGAVQLAGGAHWTDARFVGLANYRALIGDRGFQDAVQVMLLFAASTTVIEVGFALVVALLFEYVLKPSRFVRTLILVPMFVIPLVSGLTFRFLFDPLDGALAEVLRWFGQEAPDLLGSPSGAFWLVVLQDFWRMWPFVYLIIAAGLKTIPQDLLEAFALDGGTPLRAMRHIVLPLLVPSILVASGLKLIESLKAFTEIYTMTGGGPGTATTTLSMYIVREGFEFFNLPKAAAAGTLLLVLGVTLGLGYTIWQVTRSRPLNDSSANTGSGVRPEPTA